MPKKPYNIIPYRGVDTTTDPFLLGKTEAGMSALSYNLRAKHGIRSVRPGWEPLVAGTSFKRSGVYFPYGAKAILPVIHEPGASGTDITFMLTGAIKPFTFQFWYKADYLMESRYFCRFMDVDLDGDTKHLWIELYPVEDGVGRSGVRMWFITNETSMYQQAKYYYENVETDGDWHFMAIKRKADGTGVDINLDDDASVAMSVDSGDDSAAPLLDSSDIYNETSVINNDLPLWGNHLEIGDSEISMAEFRIYNTYREDSEIAADKDTKIE